MLLNEIAKVVDIASRRKKKPEAEVEIPDTIDAPKADEVTNKRREKMSPTDQLRDVAKQLGNKNK